MIEETSLARSIRLNDDSFFIVNQRGRKLNQRCNYVTRLGGRCFQGTAIHYGCSVRLVRLVPHHKWS
jgi:hypothetical protein